MYVVTFTFVVVIFSFIVKNEGMITGISLKGMSLEIKKDLETTQSYLDSIKVVRNDLEILAANINENASQVNEAKKDITSTVSALRKITQLNAEITILRTQTRLLLGGIPEPVRGRLNQDIQLMMEFAEPDKKQLESWTHELDKILREAGGQPLLK